MSLLPRAEHALPSGRKWMTSGAQAPIVRPIGIFELQEDFMSIARHALALWIVLSCGAAGAVSLNPRGLGQVLIYPYYTVNKDQDTMLSVINTGDVGKVMKVRFREGYNGRAVFDFNLFLSAHDSWTGVVTANATAADGARLSSNDSSCVDPVLAYPVVFSTAEFSATTADGGPTTATRTREGMIEIIAIGDIEPGSATDQAIAQNEGEPGCNLPALIVDDLTAPTSGLAGTGAIINVGEGTFYAYSADALTGFTDQPLLTSTSTPGEPTLASARSTASVFPQGALATVFYETGEPLELDYERGIDAVSAALMVDALNNEYLTASALGAHTDWIVTFPTKQFYVDKDQHPSDVTRPFEVPFAGSGTPDSGRSNVETSTSQLFDGNGNGWAERFGECQAPAQERCPHPQPDLAYQVNVLAFLPPSLSLSSVFGSQLATSIVADPFDYGLAELPMSESGWLKLEFNAVDPGMHMLSAGDADSSTQVRLIGLPVVGFMAYNIINSQAAPGRLANYGGTFRHRSGPPEELWSAY
jgi:hypothetical protein